MIFSPTQALTASRAAGCSCTKSKCTRIQAALLSLIPTECWSSGIVALVLHKESVPETSTEELQHSHNHNATHSPSTETKVSQENRCLQGWRLDCGPTANVRQAQHDGMEDMDVKIGKRARQTNTRLSKITSLISDNSFGKGNSDAAMLLIPFSS